MTVWMTILLLLILVEIWWFGMHCTAYLSDIRDLLTRMTDSPDRPQCGDGLDNELVDAGNQ